MNITDLIIYLRESCFVDDSSISNDPEFIALEDSQVESILRLCCYKAKININDLEEGNLYLLMLLARKEIYYRLATKSAPLFNIESESGKLERANRFDHYYKLIQALEEEYTAYIEQMETDRDVSNTDSYGTAYTKGEVFLSSRYHTMRNYSHANKPKVQLKMDNVYDDHLEVSWKLKSINRFFNYELYISEVGNVIDKYDKDAISSKAIKVLTSSDIHKNCHRITGLKPETIYHVCIVANEPNGLKGYDELQVVTEA